VSKNDFSKRSLKIHILMWFFQAGMTSYAPIESPRQA